LRYKFLELDAHDVEQYQLIENIRNMPRAMGAKIKQSAQPKMRLANKIAQSNKGEIPMLDELMREWGET